MKTSNILKDNGFKAVRVNTNSYSGVFGGSCNHTYILLNKNGEALHLDGVIYTPAGRIGTFKSLVSSGDINADCFTFKNY